MRYFIIPLVFAILCWACQAPLTVYDPAPQAPNLSKAEAQQALNLLYADYSNELIREKGKQWEQRELQHGDFKMPFFYKKWGDAPKGGYPLFISLHGGGGAPPEVNDQQYQNQQRLYNKMMEKMTGIYLAPRAPTNTWNLWHQSHIDTLFNQLIQLAMLKEQINPNKVYLLGYSAGGDGVYQLAPRMGDRWAAAAMMAGHPNDASPLSLRNTPFAIQVGGDDHYYDRNKVAGQWGKILDSLEKADQQGGYVHFTKLHKGKGHWMDFEDSIALPWMAKYERNPVPEQVVWMQGGTHHTQFYWLAVPDSLISRKATIRVSYNKKNNSINIQNNYSPILHIFIDDRMLNLNRPITVQYKGIPIFKGNVLRKKKHLQETLTQKGDPNLSFCSKITVINNTNIKLK